MNKAARLLMIAEVWWQYGGFSIWFYFGIRFKISIIKGKKQTGFIHDCVIPLV